MAEFIGKSTCRSENVVQDHSGLSKQSTLTGETIQQLAARVTSGDHAAFAKVHGAIVADSIHINGFTKHNIYAAAGMIKPKNRFENAPLFDGGAVQLQPTHKEDEETAFSGYINATRICKKKGASDYVLTQAPLSETFVDFFRMIWQLKTRIIVCITDKIYNQSADFTAYFDQRIKKKMKIGKRFLVKTMSEKREDSLVTFHLSLECRYGEDKGKNRDLIFVNIYNWQGDGYFPAQSLIKNLKFVDKLASKNEPPIVVHGASGIRRTGCFVLAFMANREIREKIRPAIFDDIVYMRKRRYGVVFQKSKLCLLLQAVIQMASSAKLLAEVPQSDIDKAMQVLDAMQQRITKGRKNEVGGGAKRNGSTENRRGGQSVMSVLGGLSKRARVSRRR